MSSLKDHKVLLGLKSFKTFDAALWAGSLEVEPKLDLLSLVASSDE